MTTDIDALAKALNQGKVAQRDREFATKLVNAHNAGHLTFNMAQWVPRLLQRIGAPAIHVKAAGVVALLSRAKASGLMYPKLWLQFPDRTPLRISIAGDRSKTPGYLMLTNGGVFGQGLYFGKISPDGELHLSADGYAQRGPLEALLSRLAQDPAAVAAEFGHLTGHCCFCSLTLKDERSVSVGYGPICAQKFGVAWGARPKKRKAAVA